MVFFGVEAGMVPITPSNRLRNYLTMIYRDGTIPEKRFGVALD
jgi:hypothetical protein